MSKVGSDLQVSYVLFIPYFCLSVFGILVTLVAWFSFHFSFSLAYLALQNVNKDYIKFLYFRNFATKSDQKPKNGMNKVKKYKLCSKLIVACKIVPAYTDEKIGSKISYKIINQPQQQQKMFWFMSCSSHIFVFRFFGILVTLVIED